MSEWTTSKPYFSLDIERWMVHKKFSYKNSYFGFHLNEDIHFFQKWQNILTWIFSFFFPQCTLQQVYYCEQDYKKANKKELFS